MQSNEIKVSLLDLAKRSESIKTTEVFRRFISDNPDDLASIRNLKSAKTSICGK